MPIKYCPTCEQEKDVELFSRKRKSKDGRCSYCKDCQKIKLNRRPRYFQDPIQLRNAHLLRKYGITPEDYDKMVEKQKHCCAICNRVTENLEVDHCHISGTIRGLLCNQCNQALGLFKDDIAVLAKAIEYLKVEREKPDLFNIFMRFGRP